MARGTRAQAGVLPLDDPRCLAHLAEGEIPLVFVRQHPLVLIRPALYAVGGVVLWFWLAARVPGGRLMDILFVGMLLLCGWLGYSELERRLNFIGVTDKRIFKTEGLVSRRYPAMRTSKVTDITLVRTVPGWLFRYSKIIIESAGQEQALHDLDFIPFPVASDRLWTVLFGSKPRAREDRPRRRLPGLRRWRDEGPDDPDDGWQGPDDGGGGPSDVGPPPDANAGGRTDRGPGPVREGDPRRDRRFLDEDTDVPSAGDWRAHPQPSGSARGRAQGIPADGESIYASPDRLQRTRRTEDTGPIPISTRRSER